MMPARSRYEKPSKFKNQRRKEERPGKCEVRPKESTRLERQQSMETEEMLEELPKVCDVGTKMNSKAYQGGLCLRTGH